MCALQSNAGQADAPPMNWKRLADYVYREIGYAISEEKFYLFDTNLRPVLKRLDINSVDKLLLRCTADKETRQEVINAVTINESYFYRDTHLWGDIEQRLLPEIIKEFGGNKKKLRILTCACSKGQEVYTLAMILHRLRTQLGDISAEIIATDIDTGVIDYAKAGIYSKFEVSRGLDESALRKYFTKVSDNAFRANDNLRSFLTFQQWNLLDPLPIHQRFDLIFCRNVLIYFDKDGKQKVFAALAHLLNNMGFLVLGGTETALNISDRWGNRKIGKTTFLQKVY